MQHFKLLLLLLALEAHAMPLPDGSSSQCAASYTGPFGFVTTKPGSSSPTSQGGDGQPSSGTTQMPDGQTNSGGATQMSDGQPNSGGATQMSDGQPNSGGGATQMSDGQPNSGGGATQMSDGQPNSGGGTQMSDGQPNSGGATQMSDGQPNSGGVTQLQDGQPNSGGVTQLQDGQPNSGGAMQMSDGQANGGTSQTACMSDDSLTLTLDNGILKDKKGRTGYIASNFQFQFDDPPQSGHLETSGFSICNGNQIALNGNTEWWMCKSGDFYNLYSKNWAAQCEPTTFTIVKQTKC